MTKNVSIKSKGIIFNIIELTINSVSMFDPGLLNYLFKLFVCILNSLETKGAVFLATLITPVAEKDYRMI